MKDIPGYEGIYKFDTELEQVYSLYNNMYLKNTLNTGISRVELSKNGKRKTYNIRHLSNICNPIENNNLVAIPGYDNYKFDLELLQVYNIKIDKYLKNRVDKDGYYRIGLYKNKKMKNYGIHQLVYICNNPTEDISDYQLDHIDNDKSNNKIENLRKCSQSDNQSNKKVHKNNKSTGIKYIHKTNHNTYRFQLVKNGIQYIKTFKTIEEAIEYRDRVVLEKCGEFSNLG